MKTLLVVLLIVSITELHAEVGRTLEPVKVELLSDEGTSLGKEMIVPKGTCIPIQKQAAPQRVGEREARQVRELWTSFTQCNTEREAAGLCSVWPRTETIDDKDDIAGKHFKDAMDYFYELFDLKHRGKSNHAPYIGCEPDLASFTKGKSCDLIVVVDYDETWTDVIPVLISANVDPKILKSSYQGEDANKIIPIGSKVGRTRIPWADDFVVVGRKGGRVDVIKAERFTYGTLYNGQTFQADGLKYLDVQ